MHIFNYCCTVYCCTAAVGLDIVSNSILPRIKCQQRVKLVNPKLCVVN